MKDIIYFLRNGYEDVTEQMKKSWKGVIFNNGGIFKIGKGTYEIFNDRIYRKINND